MSKPPDASMAFTSAFVELRKIHSDLCASVLLQTPIIEGLVLRAHHAELARLQHNAHEREEDDEVLWERQALQYRSEPSGVLSGPWRAELQCRFEPSVDGLISSQTSSSRKDSEEEYQTLARTYQIISTHKTQESSALQRWEKLVSDLTLQEGEEGRTSQPSQPLGVRKFRRFQLQPFWTISHSNKPARSNASVECSRTRATHLHYGLRVGSTVKSKESCLQRFTVHPDKKISMAHHMMKSKGQFVLILADIIDFPMMVFHGGDTLLANVMVIVSAVFWTWDVLFSFLQGFHTAEGSIEMRPACIACKYLKQWFFFDILVLGFDWVSVALFILEETDANKRESKVMRATKIGRTQRILRGLRILRFAKLFEKLTLFFHGSSREWVNLGAKISALMSVIIIVNHYIACAWYLIGKSKSNQNTWVKEQMIEHSIMFDQYFYSLHWSLTQFTPCTNNIAPANGVERFFASFVVLFALVVFSTFLSSLTSAVMQMKKLNDERNTETKLIRNFMSAKKVPLSVANQVWHYYQHHYRVGNATVQEADIRFFGALPKSLRMLLDSHVSLPILVHHPVMKQLVDSPSRPLGGVLCEIVSTMVPASGHEVFLEGEAAKSMYYIVSGKGTYTIYTEDILQKACDYLAEAVLWLSDWQHLGRLTAADNRCELLLVPADEFLKCIEAEASAITIRSLRKYAAAFAQHKEETDVSHSMASMASSGIHFLELPSLDRIIGCCDLAMERDVQVDLMVAAFQFRSLTKEKTGSTTAKEMRPRISGKGLKHHFQNWFGKVASGSFVGVPEYSSGRSNSFATVVYESS